MGKGGGGERTHLPSDGGRYIFVGFGDEHCRIKACRALGKSIGWVRIRDGIYGYIIRCNVVMDAEVIGLGGISRNHIVPQLIYINVHTKYNLSPTSLLVFISPHLSIHVVIPSHVKIQ